MSNNAAQVLPTTVYGDLRTAELTPQIQISFNYTVDNTDITTNTVTNGGTVTQADAMAVLTSSTTTSSTALLQSVAGTRYRAGNGGMMRFTTLFTTGVTGTEQYIGLLDEAGSSAAFKNGLAIGFDGTTFGFHRFANDSKTSVNQSSWDDPLDGTGDSGMTLNPAKLNVWQIVFQYLGAGAIQLFVEDDSTGDYVLVHTIDYTNQNTTPSSYNPNYHMTMWIDNGGTTSNIICKSASMAYFIEGRALLFELQQPLNTTGSIEKTSVTTETAIVTIRNKSSYNSKTNFIDSIIKMVSASIEASSANNLASINVTLNTTLGGTPSYTDIKTSDSVIDYDTAGTTVTGGKQLLSLPLAGKNDKINLNVYDFEIFLRPSDTLTISAVSSNSATVRASLLWKELF